MRDVIDHVTQEPGTMVKADFIIRNFQRSIEVKIQKCLRFLMFFLKLCWRKKLFRLTAETTWGSQKMLHLPTKSLVVGLKMGFSLVLPVLNVLVSYYLIDRS
jgi:hypothetical protein